MRMTQGEDLEASIWKLCSEFQTMKQIADAHTKYDEEEWITILVTSLTGSWTPVIHSLPLDYPIYLSAANTGANMLKMVHMVQ